jgi:hypothetical protein
MCLAVVWQAGKPPTPTELSAAASDNPDGWGVAFLGNSGNGKRSSAVYWRKGAGKPRVDQLHKLLLAVGPPALLHFRLATVGKVGAELAHPFPLDVGVPLATHGTSRRGALVHNGHWGDWINSYIPCAVSASASRKIPGGLWSDTRWIAWVTSQIGTDWLENLRGQQKIAILTASGEIRTWGSWYWERKGEIQVSTPMGFGVRGSYYSTGMGKPVASPIGI